jgi:hypothetical protein
VVPVSIYMIATELPASRREFRLFGPFGGHLRHIATFWVRVPDGMAAYPHLADSEAEKAIKEEFPEYFTEKLDCELRLWDSFPRSFLHIEPIWKCGTASNGCRVWTVEMF